MIKKHAKDLIVLLIIAIVITVAILCMDIKTADEYYAPGENQTDNKQYAYITISCKTLKQAIDNNTVKVNDKIKPYIPSDGYILQKKKVLINNGDTALDVLLKIAKEEGISIYRDNNSSYIKGINHISEFDAGKNSGWMIAVNGTLIQCSAGQYEVKEDDEMLWGYMVDYTGR